MQGCFEPLQRLLQKINYHPQETILWFTGDLVNRGPESLATLRFIKALPEVVCVLGNHDLSLLASSENIRTLHPEDTFQDILQANDKEALLQWLRHQPLLHHDAKLGYTLTHAGIFPAWSLTKAQALAKEVEDLLRGPQYHALLEHMYGNTPTQWEENLQGWDRARFIVNAFTRMRFCTPEGALDFFTKGAMHDLHLPWFSMPNRACAKEKLLFGHWAALQGKMSSPVVFPLDSGCVWGHCLTAFCLQTQERITVDCY